MPFYLGINGWALTPPNRESRLVLRRSLTFHSERWKPSHSKNSGLGRISEPQLGEMLGLARIQMDGFLKSHGILHDYTFYDYTFYDYTFYDYTFYDYTREDFERERAALKRLAL